MTTTLKNSFKIFYDKFESLLVPFQNDAFLQEQIDRLEGPQKEEFENLLDQALNFIDEIEDCKTKGEFFLGEPLVNELKELFERIINIIPEFFGPFSSYSKIFFRILSKLEDLDTLDFAESTFELNFILKPLDIEDGYFCYIPQELNESIIVISLDNMDEMEEVFSKLNIELLFYLLDALDFTEQPQTNRLYLVNDQVDVNESKIKSFIKLNKVSLGHQIHTPYEYNKKPSITSTVKWDITRGYQQFSDVVYILSEYNEQKSILDKYLKIYQVIENFMYRMTLCKLVNDSNPNMFSIRQFQTLFKSIADKEQNALKQFLGRVFSERHTGTLTFSRYLKNNWDAFVATYDNSDINTVLSELNIFPISSVIDNNFCNFLSLLIYSLRNSIVHNKETEFHVSYGNLSDYPGIKLIIEHFLLSTLEEIIYFLLIEENDLVWYQRDNIALYKAQ